MATTLEKLEEFENRLSEAETDLENRENMLEARIKAMEDKQYRDTVMNRNTKSLSSSEDIYGTDHIRDISSDSRVQLSSAGLSENNLHYNDFSNHELHEIKKMYNKDIQESPKTIMDEKLNDIIDKCINFATFSFDNYSKNIYKAELLIASNLNEAKFIDKLRIHSMAFIFFLKEDDNILYIGLILFLLSIIIYFTNIIIA